MAKWRGTAIVNWHFEAPDKRAAERRLEDELEALEPAGYRDPEVEEVDDKEWEREAPDGD